MPGMPGSATQAIPWPIPAEVERGNSRPDWLSSVYRCLSQRVYLLEDAIMKLASEGHRWQDLSQEDHNFLYEMVVFAILSALIVVFLG